MANQTTRKANTAKLNTIMTADNLERINAKNDKALNLVKLASWGSVSAMR